MSWREVELALNEKRRELVLTGAAVTEKIQKSGLDDTIFKITTLNYLNISETILTALPNEISNLINLQTLVLHSNKLESVNENLLKLDKLKVLDLSNNRLSELFPNAGIEKLTLLTSLNVSLNQLEQLNLNNSKLTTLDASNNKLKSLEGVLQNSLMELKLSRNQIESIPANINQLILLKTLDLSSNKIKTIPGEITDCTKLKELLLKDNPIGDRRLQKLIDQCRTKQVLDYVKQHSKRTLEVPVVIENKTTSVEENIKRYKINVKRYDDGIKIILEEKVKAVRPYILACILRNVEFNEETFKKFIRLQTKLHEEVCNQRNNATIATHDVKLINQHSKSKTLIYTSCPSNELKIVPLNHKTLMTGKELYEKLEQEAENLRKEKKRNTYSGIHKYLYLLKGQKEFALLKTDGSNSTDENVVNDGTVISFPPITNSETSKITINTTDILLEVTSSKALKICNEVLDQCIKEFVQFFNNDGLVVEQVKIVDVDGNLKSVYPSRTDLKFSDGFIEVVRD